MRLMSTVILIAWAIVIAVILNGIAMIRNNIVTFVSGAPVGLAIAIVAAQYTDSLGMRWDDTLEVIFAVISVIAAYGMLFWAHRYGLEVGDFRRWSEKRRRRRAVRRAVNAEVNQLRFEVE